MIDDPDATPELHELLRFTLTSMGLGIPPERVAGDFRSGLEKLRQQGSLSLEDMARIRARVDKRPDDEHEDEEWVRGYAAGYTAAWAGAVPRLLEMRDIAVPKEVFRPLYLCPDPDTLTRCLERALTVDTPEDLLTAEPGHTQPTAP
ncbi:hypothetical protein ABZ499_09120 [Streptomyces sp. NPDC019990]|uniref:hypothetical protein n=1 Tax=Streptomyces sp. NPDC019990 TaxID=3154693 RepID=UPI0033E12ADB